MTAIAHPSMLADTRVRLARMAEARSIAAMSRDLIERGLGWSWTPARVREAIADPECNVAVIRDGDAVLAFGIMRYADVRAHLELMAVRADARRLGLGSTCYRWLEAVARCAGVERVFVECRRNNGVARHFYLEHGFHERAIGHAMYRGREDGIRLVKWLR